MLYSVDEDFNVTAQVQPIDPTITPSVASFSSQPDMATALSDWPTSKLVELWNSFAGAPPFGDLKPVKKFETRESAVKRIWNALQVFGKQAEAAATDAGYSGQPGASEDARASVAAAEKRKAVIADIEAARKAKPTKPKTAKQPKAVPVGKPNAKITALPATPQRTAALALLKRKGGTSIQEVITALGVSKSNAGNLVCWVSHQVPVTKTRTADGSLIYQA